MKRRHLIGAGVTVAGAVAVAWGQRNDLARWVLTRRNNEGVQLSAAAGINEQTCVLTPEQIEGPFFIRAPLRGDIREDRSGLPLSLQMRVIDASTCQPVTNARVEIWHCDAAGRYSGYPEHLSRKPLDTLRYLGDADGRVETVNSKTFLRGAQLSDAQGLVAFQTILPGWYEPRVTHIHVKVLVEDKSYLTTQLYFAGDLINRVYASHEDYQPHGASPYNRVNDVVLGSNPDAAGLLLEPHEITDGLAATCRLGLA